MPAQLWSWSLAHLDHWNLRHFTGLKRRDRYRDAIRVETDRHIEFEPGSDSRTFAGILTEYRVEAMGTVDELEEE